MEDSAGFLILVDDDPDWREALSNFLQKKEYRVLAFESAETAFDYFSKTDIYPDLAILDCRLQPGKMSGVELAEALRQKVHFENPIIFLSSEGQIMSYASKIKKAVALTKKTSFQAISDFLEKAKAAFQLESMSLSPSV